MVSFESMNYESLLISFRRQTPFQQAAIVAAIVFVLYWLYNFLLMGMKPIAAASESTYTAIVFLVVYYLTSVFIMRKNCQMEAQTKGPKKGLRNK